MSIQQLILGHKVDMYLRPSQLPIVSCTEAIQQRVCFMDFLTSGSIEGSIGSSARHCTLVSREADIA
eukprot:2242411-Amphidinium_carterae.2